MTEYFSTSYTSYPRILCHYGPFYISSVDCIIECWNFESWWNWSFEVTFCTSTLINAFCVKPWWCTLYLAILGPSLALMRPWTCCHFPEVGTGAMSTAQTMPAQPETSTFHSVSIWQNFIGKLSTNGSHLAMKGWLQSALSKRDTNLNATKIAFRLESNICLLFILNLPY